MLRCKDVADKASAYVDRELSRTQALGMALHLLMCGNCRRFMQYFRLALQAGRPKQSLSQEQAEHLAAHITSRASAQGG